FRLSVNQYAEMIRLDILTEDDRVELLEGVLVAKMVRNPPHVLSTKLITDALSRSLPAGWHVSKEDPARTSESAPEPDCMVLRGGPRDYGDRWPGPNDMALVVEVAESTLSRDRVVKQRIYARAAIPVFWLVNLIDRRIEVYSDPSGPNDAPDYQTSRHYGPDEEIPLILDGLEIARFAVRDLLP
ncbi:MAG: Uma2 family endonuclease, partial [Isosphaeraceae bacterium]